MKMRKNEHFAKHSSSIGGQTFSVKMNEKLFETLFANLYRYKEAAATRETVSNAIDAHMMRDRQHKVVPGHYNALTPAPQRTSIYLAPKGKRVELHLPSYLEPWLEIKDFGVGLPIEKIMGEHILASEDEVLLEGNIIVNEDEVPENMAVIGYPDQYGDLLVFRRENGEIIRSPGLYTTLFHSTKEDDTDQIGAYGLGAKSPLAVSDTFSLESRYEGKLHRYIMYLNSERIPTIELVTKDEATRDPLPEDTTEFNGITVRIPINNGRYHAFRLEMLRLGKVIEEQYRPEVICDEWDDWEEIDRSNKVFETYLQPKGDVKTHFAVMGGVSYPVALDQIEPDIRAILERFPSTYTFFPLGELSVPPSREDLSYDSHTIEVVNEYYKKLVLGLVDEKIKDVQKAREQGLLVYIHRIGEVVEEFGKSFASHIQRNIPKETRFKNGELRIPTAVRPEYDPNSYLSIETPNEYFDIQFFLHGQQSGVSMSAHNFLKIKEGKTLLIIEDNNIARNMKVATASADYSTVVVVRPNREAYTYFERVTGNKEQILNSEDILSELTKWGFDNRKEYLPFADAVVGYLDEILVPDEVKFMSELKYKKPEMETYPGLFDCHMTYRRHKLQVSSYRELKSTHVAEVIEKGERLIYAEISNNNLVHKINGREISVSSLFHLYELLSKVKIGKERKSYFEQVNSSYGIILARRKAAKILEKHPDTFISIEEALKDVGKYIEPIILSRSSRTLLKCIYDSRTQRDRLDYIDGLVTYVERGVFEDYFKNYSRCSESAKSNFDLIHRLATPTLRVEMEKYRKIRYSSIVETYTEICDYHGLPVVTQPEIMALQKVMGRFEYDLGKIEGISHKLGFRIDFNKTTHAEHKLRNRNTLEKHKMIAHLVKTHTPSSYNILDDKEDQFKSALRGMIG